MSQTTFEQFKINQISLITLALQMGISDIQMDKMPICNLWSQVAKSSILKSQNVHKFFRNNDDGRTIYIKLF